MSNVDELTSVELAVHNGDSTAKDEINAAKLDTNHGVLRSRINQIVRALDTITRDDNTLHDNLVRLRNLHPEILTNFGSGGNAVTITQSGSGGGGGYNVQDVEFGAAGTGLSTPLTADEAADFNARFGVFGAQGAYAIVAGDERDYAAIQCALWKAANTGKPVYVPAGSYRINKPLVLTWTATPITGQPALPKLERVSGDGPASMIMGYGIAAERGIVELLGTSNIYSGNLAVDHLCIRADTSCNVGSFCLRVGDMKTSFSARHVRLEGPNCLRLETAAITSYASICTRFENCALRSNYASGWGDDTNPLTAPAVSAVEHKTTVVSPSRVDNVVFASCLLAGRVKSRATTAHYDNTLFYVSSHRPSPYNRCFDQVGGKAHLTACYFEDHHTAVHISPTETYCQGLSLIGCIFNGGPVYASTNAVVAVGDNALLNNGIGNLTLISCDMVADYSGKQISLNRCYGQAIDCHDKSYLSDDLVVEVLNGACLMWSSRGRIKWYGARTDQPGIDRLGGSAGSVNGSKFDNFGNSNAGVDARYTMNFFGDTAQGSIIVYSSTYTVAPTRAGGVLVQNATGDLMLGTGGSVRLRIEDNGRIRINECTDDGVSALQIGEPLGFRDYDGASVVTDGAFWYDTALKAWLFRGNGFKQVFSTVPENQNIISNLGVSNSTSETVLGSSSYAANFWKVRKTVRVRVRGYISWSLAGPALTVRLKFGGVTLCSRTFTPPAGLTNEGFLFDGEITCRTTGGTGTVFAQGFLFYGTEAIAIGATATATINTTVTGNVEFTAQWASASPNATIVSTHALSEVLN
jgi:hypothetical protein